MARGAGVSRECLLSQVNPAVLLWVTWIDSSGRVLEGTNSFGHERGTKRRPKGHQRVFRATFGGYQFFGAPKGSRYQLFVKGQKEEGITLFPNSDALAEVVGSGVAAFAPSSGLPLTGPAAVAPAQSKLRQPFPFFFFSPARQTCGPESWARYAVQANWDSGPLLCSEVFNLFVTFLVVKLSPATGSFARAPVAQWPPGEPRGDWPFVFGSPPL